MPLSKQQLAKVTDGNQENRSKCIRKNHLTMLIMRRNDFRGVVNVVIGLEVHFWQVFHFIIVGIAALT